MAIDELEVLLNLDLDPLEDDLEEAVDKFDRLDGRSTQNAQNELDDAAEAADDLSDELEEADDQDVNVDVNDGEVSQLQRRLAALDGRSVEIDTDVDRERLVGAFSGGGSSGGGSRGRDRVRLPGELDEVQEGIQAIGLIPPQIQALAGAATAAVAALGAGAGLAGVATQLAAEMGPQGLQSDVKAAQSTFKEAGREFASTFSGVIRSEVLPAARGLSLALQTVDEDLASFSGAMIDLLKGLQGAGPVIGAVVGAGRASGESQSNADALAQGIGDVPGIREITRTMTQGIERVRERFERDLIPKEEMLSQIKSLRLDAVKQLQKLEQKVPGAFPPALIDRFAQGLREVKKQLQEVNSVPLDSLPSPGDAEQVETAAPTQADTDPTSDVPDRVSPSPGGGGRSLAERARTIRRSMFQVRRQIRLNVVTMSTFSRVGTQALAQLGQGFGRVLTNIITLQGGIKSVGDAFQAMGRVAVQVLRQVISKLASAAALATVLGPILGVSSASFGSIFKATLGGGQIPGLASGGLIERGGIARVHKGEAVVNRQMMQNGVGQGGGTLTASISMDELLFQLDRNLKARGKGGLL